MKKVISLVLAVVILTVLCTTSVVSVSADEATTVNGVSVNKGDTLRVTCFVSSDSEWEDFQGDMSYDYSGLRLDSFDMPNTEKGTIANTTLAGFVYFNGTCYSEPYDFTTEKEFYVAEFTVLGSGEYTIKNNWSVIDDDNSQSIIHHGPIAEGRVFNERISVAVVPKPTVTTTTTVKPTTKPTTTTQPETKTTTAPSGGDYTTPTMPFPSDTDKIVLNKNSASVYTGKTTALSATVVSEGTAYGDVSWTSSNSSIARVSATGVVTGVKKGTVTITATAVENSSGKTLQAVSTITVRQSVTSIKMSKSAVVFTGQKKTLKPTVAPSYAYNKALSFKSSNSKIAKVGSTTGVVTGVKKGSANITAKTTDGSKKTAVCKLSVRQSVTKVALNIKNVKLKKGGIIKVTPKVNTTAYNKKLTVKSANNKIAKVNTKAVSSGKSVTITAVKKGSTRIVFTAKDGSKKNAICKVKVTK